MTREAIIWRESVYKNEFRCNECNEPLADAESGDPLGTTLFDIREKLVICPNCGNVVARVETITDADDLPDGLNGNWEDYLRGRQN